MSDELTPASTVLGYREELARLKAENEQLRASLAKANSYHEEFERKWYLATDEVESLRREFDELKAWCETVRPVLAAVKALAVEWADTSGSASSVDAIGDRLRALMRVAFAAGLGPT